MFALDGFIERIYWKIESQWKSCFLFQNGKKSLKLLQKYFYLKQIEMNISIEMYLLFIAKLILHLLRCIKMKWIGTNKRIKTQKILPYVH